MNKILVCLMLFTSCSLFSNGSKTSLNVTGVKPEKNKFFVSWIKNLDPNYETGNLPINLSGPLIHDGVVYSASGEGMLEAFSIKNGRVLWREKIQEGMNTTPIVVDNLLIYADLSGRVYAKDLNTNEFKYQFDLGSSVDSEMTVAKGRLFLQTRNHKVFSIDVATGKILWSYKRSVPYFSTLQRTSKPLIVENRVFAGFADGYLLAFSLEDGQVVWEKKMTTSDKFVDVDMSPTYYRGKIIVGSIAGKAEIIGPQGGELVKRLDFSVNRDALYFENQVIYGTTDGRVISLDSSYDIQKDVKITETSISSISSWKNGFVVTTTGKYVYFLDKTFNVISTFDLGNESSAVFSRPSVNEDKMAIMSSRNRLYLFQ